MKTLTASAKRQITADWHSRFPSLSVHQPMWMMRRVGPLLVGVCLNRDSGNDNYKPISHVHCLCRTDDFISLTLNHQPLKPLANGRDGLMYVRLSEHEKTWREQADLLEEQAYVPLEGPISIEQVLEGYRRFLARPVALKFPHCYEDMALLLAWVGRSNDAINLVSAACDDMASWPEGWLERWGGVDGWRTEITESVGNPASLRTLVEKQVQEIGLVEIATEELE